MVQRLLTVITSFVWHFRAQIAMTVAHVFVQSYTYVCISAFRCFHFSLSTEACVFVWFEILAARDLRYFSFSFLPPLASLLLLLFFYLVLFFQFKKSNRKHVAEGRKREGIHSNAIGSVHVIPSLIGYTALKYYKHRVCVCECACVCVCLGLRGENAVA